MTEIVVTLKGGDKESPWLVIHGETVDEVDGLLDQSIARLYPKIALAEKLFTARHLAPTHDQAVALVQRELGGEAIAPAAPIPMQAAAPAAPWEKPTPTAVAPAAPPWAVGAASKPGIKLPFGQAGTEQDEKNKQIKSQLKAGGFGVNWNKDRKVFEFDSAPPEGVVAWLKSTLPGIGGSYVE